MIAPSRSTELIHSPPDFTRSLARSTVRDDVLARLYPRGVALIEGHRDAGHAVFLPSSSPQDYVEVLAEALGMDGAIGTRAEVRDSRYTGRAGIDM